MPEDIQITPREGVTQQQPEGSPPEESQESPGQEQTEQAQAGALPPKLLQLPSMQALVAGSPPAVSARLSEFRNSPEATLLASNKEALLKAGFGFYRSVGGDFGVVFNQLHIHADELRAADKAGKLQVLAPPLDVVNQAVGSSGAANPVLTRQSVPNTFAGAPSPSVSQFAAGAPAVPPPPASVPRQAQAARLRRLQPGGPLSGPAPGAGRLLNQIMTPVA